MVSPASVSGRPDGANRRQSGQRQRRGIDWDRAVGFLATMAALIAIVSA